MPGQLAPAHKFRKIKGASVIRPAYSRAYINNGYIEVEPEDSDDESGWKNVETYGKVVRLPAKGIKLDFLSRYVFAYLARSYSATAGLTYGTAFVKIARANLSHLSIFLRLPVLGLRLGHLSSTSGAWKNSKRSTIWLR